jgi:hypothetical protein
MTCYIKAQGYDVSGETFSSTKKASAEIKKAVAIDLVDCRRKFGTAVVRVWNNVMWEVRPVKDEQGPLWSRYTIHSC